MRHSKNGKSIRARSFEAFDRGERPVPFARANGFKLSTVYTYWHQYKQMRCISSKKVVTGEENAWNPTEAIVEILKLLAIHTGIPQNAVTDQFRASWEEIQQMVNMRVFDLAQLNRKRAAQILNETVALITVCWASGLPPEATLDILRR